MTGECADHIDMTIIGTRQNHRRAHTPSWFSVAAWSSLALLLLAGLAGAVGLG